MEQQTTLNAAMTALLERYQEMVENPDQEDLEREIYVEAWQGNWQEALRLLRLLPGPVTRETAGEYLFQALCSAPPQVFAELLDYLPHGEYTGRATVPAPWMPGNGRRRHHRWEVRMEGTLTPAGRGEEPSRPPGHSAGAWIRCEQRLPDGCCGAGGRLWLRYGPLWGGLRALPSLHRPAGEPPVCDAA